MTIKATDTIGYISGKYTRIIATAPDKIVKVVESLPVPDAIPMIYRPMRRLFRKTVKYIPARDVSQLTVADLNHIEELSGKAQTDTGVYMTALLSLLLQIPAEDVKRLGYLSAMAYLRNASKDLAKIPEYWKALSNLPRTPEEQQAAVERPNMGWGMVLMEFCRGMKGSVRYKESDKLLWAEVYAYFKEEFYRAMERKNYERIMKANSKSYRRR